MSGSHCPFSPDFLLRLLQHFHRRDGDDGDDDDDDADFGQRPPADGRTTALSSSLSTLICAIVDELPIKKTFEKSFLTDRFFSEAKLDTYRF